MRLNNEQEVKKWLRNIPLVKRELELKMSFFKDLAADLGVARANEYDRRIDELKQRMDNILSDTERLFELLEDNERLVMTAKYINHIRWDFIEYHVFYSRRHAIRIHNEAIKKLVGQEVNS